MSNPTIRTMKRGDVLQVGYKSYLDSNKFLGFYTDIKGTGTGFNTLAELRSNVADSDCYHALFLDIDGGFSWAAYFWKGRWRVGSSADTLKMAAI